MDKLLRFAARQINQYPMAWQFIKFCTVGISNLAIYIAIYWVMTRLFLWHYLPASVAGFLISVTWSFYFNLKWTFKHKSGDRRRQYIIFIVANLISMSINLMLLTVFIEVLSVYDLAAQFICSVIVAFFNFGLNRFWTFKNS